MPGGRWLSLCWSDGGPHTQHSESRAGTWGGGQTWLGGAVTHLGGRLRLTYTEGKGCVSPTRASSLFGDRVMGQEGDREGRKEVSTASLL